MSRADKIRKILAAFLAAVLALSMAACGAQGGNATSGGEPAQGQSSAQEGETSGPEASAASEAIDRGTLDESLYAKGQAVPTCVPANFRTKNNLIVKEFEVEQGDSFTASYIQIEGLKDKEVQKAVNRKLMDLYNSLADPDYLPPYTGAKAKLRSFPNGPDNTWVNVYAAYSADNILSVVGKLDRSYADENNDLYWYISDTQTMNFDLTTGLEIRITDIFTDDADAYGLLDAAVRDGIRKANTDDQSWTFFPDDIILTAPFEGIKADQKYYLDDFGENLYLVFDYETPEIYCSFSDQTFSVSLSGVNALGERFHTEGSIFEEAAPVYSLIYRPFDDKKDVEEYRERDFIDSDLVYASVTESWNEEMPAGQTAFAKFGDDELRSRETAFLNVYNASAEDFPDETIRGSMYSNSYCSRYGNYTNVTKYTGADIYTDGSWQYLYTDYATDYTVFKGDSSEPLSLSDVFVPGSNIVEILRDAFMRRLSRENPDAEISSAKLENLLYDAVEHADFELTADTIYFVYDCDIPPFEEIVLNPGDLSDEMRDFMGYMESLSYEDIRCKYLTIFD